MEQPKRLPKRVHWADEEIGGSEDAEDSATNQKFCYLKSLVFTKFRQLRAKVTSQNTCTQTYHMCNHVATSLWSGSSLLCILQTVIH